MASKSALVLLAAAGVLAAQDAKINPYDSFKYNLPEGSPLSMLSVNYENSHAAPPAGAHLNPSRPST